MTDVATKNTNLETLTRKVRELVAPLGYDVIAIEVANFRQKLLRIFVDFLNPVEGRSVGIEDCVTITKALDEPLDHLPEIENLFHGTYELEVSSPGVERPLCRSGDFERFTGKDARIHLYRPLTAEEIENTTYLAKNPKQKNFVGTLMGMKNDKVHLGISVGTEKTKKPNKKGKGPKKTAPDTNSVEDVFIPLPLISKAHLEVDFAALERLNERE